MNPPVNGKCSKGETMRSLFDWNEAQWIGGSYGFANWTSRHAVAANAIKQTIDFPRLQSVVTSTAVLLLKTTLQNQVSFY